MKARKHIVIRQRKGVAILLVLLFFQAGLAWADVRLPALFSENMVLQGGIQTPIWGWGDPGEKVIVELGGHISTTIVDDNGKWKLYLSPLDMGGPFTLKVKGDKNALTIENVLVGEVWVCAGQSNMAMEVKNCNNAQEEIATANYPNIRYFQIANTKSSKPLDDFTVSNDSRFNKWEMCNSSTVAHFTGTGYYFIRELHERLNIPVGIINASWGGTTAEAWIPKDALSQNPELQIILENWPDYNNDEEWLKKEYEGYLKLVKEAKKNHTELPLYFNEPSVLYNGMLAPVIPYGIRGVAWYQGESNAYRAYQYRTLFPAMIAEWRRNWGQGNFPFLFVQLANYHFEPQVFPELREAQSMALTQPNTAMVAAIDIGNPYDIHPGNKQEVGRRLSIAALSIAYKEKLIYSGPKYKSMKVEKGKCILSFTHCGDGLVVKGDSYLKGFFIAGEDRKFHKAYATIRGTKVMVSCDKVEQPVAVRYAWANHPENSNLYNKSGEQVNLPASPFRTDDWPGLTINRK